MSSKGVVVLLAVLVLVASEAIVARIDGDFFAPSAPAVPEQVFSPTIPAAGEKVVCVVFDDGWRSQLNAVPVLELYNFSATFAIVTSYSGYPAYMSWTDIASVAKKGNDIVSHTHSHVDLCSVDNATLYYELSKSQQILRSKGYPANVLVYPYGDGDRNATVRSLVSQYYLLARGVQAGKYDLSSTDRFTINAYSIYNYTSLADFAAYLNGTGGSTITLLTYHKVSDEEEDMAVTLEAFRAQMQYLKDNNFTVKTMSELFLKTLS